jgi:hypothetical protein
MYFYQQSPRTVTDQGTHQENEQASGVHLDSACMDFPNCHGALLPEEPHGTDEAHEQCGCLEGTCYRLAKQIVAKDRTRVFRVLQPI